MCENIENIKEIWDKLKATYQQIDVTTHHIIHKIDIHMGESANIIEFLNEFQCLIDDVTITC